MSVDKLTVFEVEGAARPFFLEADLFEHLRGGVALEGFAPDEA